MICSAGYSIKASNHIATYFLLAEGTSVVALIIAAIAALTDFGLTSF